MSVWAILSIGFGGLCGLSALVLLVLDLMRYRKTDGTITGNRSYTGEHVAMYAPTIRYRTDDGVDRTFQSICYFSSSPYSKGESIPVRYHPTIARLCGVNKLMHRLLGVLLLALVAVMFVWLGVQL